MSNVKDLPVLEDWSEYPNGKNLQIRGTVYNHPNFHDGSTVQTGDILAIKDGVIHTEIRDYKLGVQRPTYDYE